MFIAFMVGKIFVATTAFGVCCSRANPSSCGLAVEFSAHEPFLKRDRRRMVAVLVDLMTEKEIRHVPYRREYEIFKSRMSNEEIVAIKAELNRLIEGTEIQTSGWMPGKNWGGTVYEPIYEKAARRDHGASARCFGLMVWEVFMERPERWTSGRFENRGQPIGSRTYFLVK